MINIDTNRPLWMLHKYSIWQAFLAIAGVSNNWIVYNNFTNIGNMFQFSANRHPLTPYWPTITKNWKITIINSRDNSTLQSIALPASKTTAFLQISAKIRNQPYWGKLQNKLNRIEIRKWRIFLIIKVNLKLWKN